MSLGNDLQPESPSEAHPRHAGRRGRIGRRLRAAVLATVFTVCFASLVLSWGFVVAAIALLIFRNILPL